MEGRDATEVVSDKQSSRNNSQGGRHLDFRYPTMLFAGINVLRYESAVYICNNNMADRSSDKKTDRKRGKGERKEERKKRKHSENEEIELAKHYETL